MQDYSWDKIETILDNALRLPRDDRIRYIKRSCEDDSNLYDKIIELLESIEKAEEKGFLDNLASDHETLIHDYVASIETYHDDWIGKTIGSYEIAEVLGTGGMSLVFKATRNDGQFSQTVAIKFLQKEILSPETLQRFKMEQEILAGLNHSHIAQLYDGGITNEGIPYLIMEFIDGKPIDQFCNDRRLSIEERLELFKKVCEAVRYAHNNLVIHRDLKAQNILVTPEGNVKVLDFGIAKLLDSKMKESKLLKTLSGRKFWTPQYAAPEQVKGELATTATDIYTLGILLHKILTDRFPLNLDNKSLGEVERIICREDPTRPSRALAIDSDSTTVCNKRRLSCSDLRKKLEGDLDAIVLKALRKDPNYRYSSVDQLINDLDNYQQDLPLTARKDTTQYRLYKFVNRNKRKLATFTLFFIVILGFGSYHLYQINYQKMLAEAEAQKAQQATDYMVNLFESANPTENSEDTLNVYDLLERGKEKIAQMSDQPNAQISLILAIGSAYQNIGEYREARGLLHKADSLSNKLYGPRSIESANVARLLGNLYQEINNTASAIAYFKKAADISNGHSVKNRRTRALALHGLANAFLVVGKTDSAEIFMKKALKLKETDVSSPQNILESRMGLGKIYHAQGKYRKAENVYLEVIKEIGLENKYNNEFLAITLYNLGKLLQLQKRYRGASIFYSNSKRIFKNIYGEKHSKTVKLKFKLAEVRNQIDRLKEAD